MNSFSIRRCFGLAASAATSIGGPSYAEEDDPTPPLPPQYMRYNIIAHWDSVFPHLADCHWEVFAHSLSHTIRGEEIYSNRDAP